MERKIGETFEYEGKKLKVVETAKDLCFDCYFFDGVNCQRTERGGGECSNLKRADCKPVIFVEVHEQPQELNLCEILKDCPKGTEFWSDNYGEVKFIKINPGFEEPILTRRTDGYTASYTKEGWHSICFPANCLLWPSRDCRDWAKFTAPWYKKDKFNPNTLQPFDKVLVKHGGKEDKWTCNIFSFYSEGTGYDFECLDDVYENCIPYNNDTKHLVGTTDEAPEYYRYWED